MCFVKDKRYFVEIRSYLGRSSCSLFVDGCAGEHIGAKSLYLGLQPPRHSLMAPSRRKHARKSIQCAVMGPNSCYILNLSAELLIKISFCTLGRVWTRRQRLCFRPCRPASRLSHVSSSLYGCGRPVARGLYVSWMGSPLSSACLSIQERSLAAGKQVVERHGNHAEWPPSVMSHIELIRTR